MKQQKNRFVSLLLVLSLLFASALPVFAEEYGYYGWMTEGDYEFWLEQTESGPALSDIAYCGESEEAMVPKTLAGITLTPDNFTGKVFSFSWRPVSAIVVEEDNLYFKSVDGALYSKDGKTLVYYPQTDEERDVLQIPDGVETLGESFIRHNTSCLVLPDSVSRIDGRYCFCDAVMASPGGFAEAYAKKNHLSFIIQGEGHKHVYLYRVITPPTCMAGGVAELWCPCGDTHTMEMQPSDHFFPAQYVVVGRVEYRIPGDVCEYCGISYEEVYGHAPEPTDSWYIGGEDDDCDCDCICHRFIDESSFDIATVSVISLLKDFFYRLQIVIWRITGTHQYCECGKRHY